MRRCEPEPFKPLDFTTSPQQLGECAAIPELNTVSIDVLAQQRNFDCPVSHKCFDFGQNLPGASVFLFAPKRWNYAEGAGVVATNRNRYPAAKRALALGWKGRRENLQGFQYLDLGFSIVPCTFEQNRQRTHVVSSEHHVHPRCTLQDYVLILLRQTAANGNLELGIGLFFG